MVKIVRVSDDGLLAAYVEGRRVGRLFAVLGDDDPTTAYITDVLVDELYRRQGVGTALVKEFERFAREHRITTVRLFMAKDEALPFWERLGYSRSGPNKPREKRL